MKEDAFMTVSLEESKTNLRKKNAFPFKLRSTAAKDKGDSTKFLSLI